MRHITTTLFFNPKNFKVKGIDLLSLIGLSIGFIYLAVKDTPTFTVVSLLGLVFIACYQISQVLPAIENYFKKRFSFWQIAAVGMAITIVLCNFHPAHALFLQDLETKVTTVIAGTSSGIPASSVALMFNLLRVVFVFMVVASAIYAYVQAQQGNDARPIIMNVLIGFATVMAIDVVTVFIAGA